MTFTSYTVIISAKCLLVPIPCIISDIMFTEQGPVEVGPGKNAGEMTLLYMPSIVVIDMYSFVITYKGDNKNNSGCANDFCKQSYHTYEMTIELSHLNYLQHRSLPYVFKVKFIMVFYIILVSTTLSFVLI